MSWLLSAAFGVTPAGLDGTGGRSGSLSSVMLEQLLSGLASVLTQSRAHDFNWTLLG